MAGVDRSAALTFCPDPSSDKAQSLQRLAVSWYNNNARHFPWRDTANPFHILVAEILLRQTQAGRVADPYLELISMYPDPATLAGTNPIKLRRWIGPLGLVKRADYLIIASRQILDLHDGLVPRDLDSLTKLPGIGIYSARAILCLAFGEAVPMVDESSGRLLRRVLGLQPKGPAYADRRLMEIVGPLIPKDRPRDFNLALLDIAAAVCKPKNPRCPLCPLAEICEYPSSGSSAG